MLSLVRLPDAARAQFAPRALEVPTVKFTSNLIISAISIVAVLLLVPMAHAEHGTHAARKAAAEKSAHHSTEADASGCPQVEAEAACGTGKCATCATCDAGECDDAACGGSDCADCDSVKAECDKCAQTAEQDCPHSKKSD